MPVLRCFRRLAFTALALFGSCLDLSSAEAALKEGAKAPDFTAPAVQGENSFTFDLDAALKKGPVVLYFYPKAFTSGCTVEAHAFAEAADRFKADGATLLGLSSDDIATLRKFSTLECRAKFPVAADPDLKIITAYDVALTGEILRKIPTFGKMSDRTSFVIAPDHTILYVYSALNPDKHVANTLAAIEKYKAAHPG